MNHKASAFILGFFICTGLSVLGIVLGNTLLEMKQLDRSVTVKGLAEREFTADIAIWPIRFAAVENDISRMYEVMEANTQLIIGFLNDNGISQEEITCSFPYVSDALAQQYGDGSKSEYRYKGYRTITVYTRQIEKIRTLMGTVAELGKKGIVFSGNEYDSMTEYLFTRLNEIKPDMIEESTAKAREVAQKFAKDSGSKLGKIKQASQGQFTITDRDKNNPHIKSIRVVSTIEYYLTD